ncbi:MAG: hypothetical protein K2Y25_12365 [Pseudomonadaceae bacterium]|jgi:hypothetical protein|nr:hypothetical protein [Pseudomonadaceae bacterium]
MSDTPELPEHAEQIAELKRQWAESPAKHWQLLRMLAQPTERGSGARGLRFAELARSERHHPHLSMLRLNVQLPAQVLHREHNVLELWLDHRLHTAEFGPTSGLQTEPSNRGLGRFLVAQAINWALPRCGHYQVIGGDFSGKDNFDESLRVRRDHLLETLGFNVTYSDTAQLKGGYSASLLSDLKGQWNGEKVQIVGLLEAGKMLQQADQTLAEQAIKLRQKDELLAASVRDEGALRFTISTLVIFCLFQAALLLWLMVR